MADWMSNLGVKPVSARNRLVSIRGNDGNGLRPEGRSTLKFGTTLVIASTNSLFGVILSDTGRLCELVCCHLDDLLIRENGEGTLEGKRLLLAHCSLEPKIHSTCARKCYSFDFPFHCHLEGCGQHVEVSLETWYGAAGLEASPDVDNAVDPVFLADPS